MDEEAPGAGGLLAVGRVIRPHGIRGAVIVEAISDSPGRFTSGERLVVEGPGARTGELTVRTVSRSGGRLLLSFEEVAGIDAAEAIRGRLLFIPADRAAPLGRGEYWIHEIIGMAVFDERGEMLGEVSDLVSGTAQDLLVIEEPEGGEFQVPFVEEFVLGVERDRERITVRLIPGMGPGGGRP